MYVQKSLNVFSIYRYGSFYLRSMEKLPPDVLDQFCEGNHVLRHNPGLWNGIWSNMFIETTFLRYGHGPGGIVGITLKPSTLKRWALSLHICSRLVRDVSMMTDEKENVVLKHKEEMPARMKQDAVDRQKIGAKLQFAVDPLDISEQQESIVNIVTGQVTSTSVTVDQSVEVGYQQWQDFELSWPEGFHGTIPKKIVTMSITKKQMNIEHTPIYDTDLIYSRVLGLQQSRDISLKDVLAYELSPVPTAVFEDNGDLRLTKSKATLKNKLQVEQSGRLQANPQFVVIDGCALMWVINWPTNGTVIDYVENFVSTIRKKLENSNVYLVFDRYHTPSIKDATRLARAGKDGTQVHQLNTNTPLPSQKVTLCVTKNKVQMINIICQVLKQKTQSLPVEKKPCCHRG